MSSITIPLNICGQCFLPVAIEDRAVSEKCQHVFHQACLHANHPTCLTCHDLCAICQDSMLGDITADPLTKLSCDHIFHENCINPWINGGHLTCPTCRASINIQHDLPPTSVVIVVLFLAVMAARMICSREDWFLELAVAVFLLHR
jgi:hypothetical protein